MRERHPSLGHTEAWSGVSGAMSNVRRNTWSVGILAVAIAAAVGACSLFPGASLSPREQALRQLAAQQAIWQSKGIDDYTITVEKVCFCPSAQYAFTIVDGIVTQATHDDAPVKPAEVAGLPKTVTELFAVVAGLPLDAAVKVEYDPDFGFPTRVEVDPIANAIDDEYSIFVHGFQGPRPTPTS